MSGHDRAFLVVDQATMRADLRVRGRRWAWGWLPARAVRCIRPVPCRAADRVVQVERHVRALRRVRVRASLPVPGFRRVLAVRVVRQGVLRKADRRQACVRLVRASGVEASATRR